MTSVDGLRPSASVPLYEDKGFTPVAVPWEPHGKIPFFPGDAKSSGIQGNGGATASARGLRILTPRTVAPSLRLCCSPCPTPAYRRLYPAPRGKGGAGAKIRSCLLLRACTRSVDGDLESPVAWRVRPQKKKVCCPYHCTRWRSVAARHLHARIEAWIGRPSRHRALALRSPPPSSTSPRHCAPLPPVAVF
jgi:hypothetical protein